MIYPPIRRVIIPFKGKNLPLLKVQEEASTRFHPLIFQLNGYYYPSVGVGTLI